MTTKISKSYLAAACVGLAGVLGALALPTNANAEAAVTDCVWTVVDGETLLVCPPVDILVEPIPYSGGTYVQVGVLTGGGVVGPGGGGGLAGPLSNGARTVKGLTNTPASTLAGKYCFVVSSTLGIIGGTINSGGLCVLETGGVYGEYDVDLDARRCKVLPKTPPVIGKCWDL